MYQLPIDTPFGRRVTDQNIIEVVQEHADRIFFFEKKQDSHDLLLSELSAKSEELNTSVLKQNETLLKINDRLQDISNKMPNLDDLADVLQYGRKIKSVEQSVGLGRDILRAINDLIGLVWRPILIMTGLVMLAVTTIKDSHFLAWLTSWLK